MYLFKHELGNVKPRSDWPQMFDIVLISTKLVSSVSHFSTFRLLKKLILKVQVRQVRTQKCQIQYVLNCQ